MKKETVRFDVAPQTYALLLRLIESGLWGETADEVALQCMYRGLQEAHRGGSFEPRIVEHKPREPQEWQDKTGWVWCSQCDRRVAGGIAKRCVSPFCTAKASFSAGEANGRGDL